LQRRAFLAAVVATAAFIDVFICKLRKKLAHAAGGNIDATDSLRSQPLAPSTPM
jgi:hypothetical protein